MDRPTLFMLNPWYDAPGDGPYYCPDCGIVEGFFFYNPAIREQVDIIHVDFQRPRPAIIQQLGEENQGSPVLVLTEPHAADTNVKKSLSTGKAFIDEPIALCNYLTETFGGVFPHPQD